MEKEKDSDGGKEASGIHPETRICWMVNVDKQVETNDDECGHLTTVSYTQLLTLVL